MECCLGNVMLAVGSLPAGAGPDARLRWEEIFSYGTGEMIGQARCNLEALLPLRAQIEQALPASAQLTDCQVLLALTFATVPWPIDVKDDRFYGEESDGDPIFPSIAWQFAHVERMPGHPQAPPPQPQQAPPQPQQAQNPLQALLNSLDRNRPPPGVPRGMDLDNSCTGDRGYRYVDGLPLSNALTPAFCAFFNEKRALVARFHRGE